jgi:hypothetical protein
MMSRGLFVTLTGLLALGATTGALAQPAVPSRPPSAVVVPVAPQPPVIVPPPSLPEPVIVDVDELAPMGPAGPVIVGSEIGEIDVDVPTVDTLQDIPEIAAFALRKAEKALKVIELPNVDIDLPNVEIELANGHVRELHRYAQEEAQRVHEQVDRPREKAERERDAIERSREAVERARQRLDHVRGVKDKVDAKLPKLAFDDFKPQKFAYLDGPKLSKLPFGQSQVVVARKFERCDSGRGEKEDVEDRFYDCGRRAIDEYEWQRAADYFARAAAVKGTRADGALYWKAYSQNRLGQRAEALTTLAEFKGAYAKSRWASDASALEVKIRQEAGQKVDPSGYDDEMKLIALNALGDSPDAVPILEKLLQGPQPPKLKNRALFVLAQNQSPAARGVLAKVAKGGANPELQLKAVQYLGRFRAPESREILWQVYASSPDVSVKRAIIRAYAESNDRERLVAVARTETDQSLRLEAVRRLGDMQAGAELADLYARESSPEVKKQILRGFGNSGQTDRLMTIAQTEQDPELKRTAVRSLGFRRPSETGTQLVDIYTKEKNVEVRKAAVEALFTQGNATALIALARKETDPELRKALMNRLVNMRDSSGEVKAFMLELLK